MSWFGKKRGEPQTVTQTVTLKNPPRSVRMDVVAAIDQALGRAAGGGEVMHAIDPARIASFQDGGPPVWSVGVAKVQHSSGGYTLLTTYGFSHAVSPDPLYQASACELSLAVPAPIEPMPWGVAALRQLARYVLTSGNELQVGDVMPCHTPFTRFPFPPHLQGQLPTTSVDSLVVTTDPVLGAIDTPAGRVEVRRIVGVTTARLHELGPLPIAERVRSELARNPLAWTDVRG